MVTCTLKEVSAEAGVSIALASVVLNNKKGRMMASPATRERILAAARHLGYEPNRTARALRFSRSFLIGAIASNIDSSFVPEILAGIESSCLDTSYNVIIGSCSKEEDFLVRLNNFRRRGIDGLMLIGCNSDFWHHAMHDMYGGKLVYVGCASTDASCGSVYVSPENLGYLAGTALFQQGHREIGYISNTAISRKLSGIHSAGYTDETCHVCVSANDLNPGIEAALSLLKAHPGITGIYTDSDELGVAVIKAVHFLGLNVPNDISVIGTDDAHFCHFTTPELSSVRQPRCEQGKLATTLLMEMLDGKAPRNIVMNGELVLRNSVAKRKN